MSAFGPTPLWLAAVRLAESQFGVVSASQLVALGASKDWIRGRVRRRVLRPVYQGVYALGHAVLVPQGRWLAAALAVPGAVLSHRTAAAIWRLAINEYATPELTTTREARSRPGLILHRSRTLTPKDVMRWHGTGVTRIERTLVDLADVLNHDELIRVTDALPRIDKPRLAETLARAGPRKAHTALQPLLDDGPRTRSELERAFLAMARRHGLPQPQCNVRVEGLLVDAYWPEHRLVVECDSRRWHGSWAARRNDHARDARLQLARLVVLRMTWTEVRHRPELGAARIRPFLG
jgi:very-short-patch-repair endonuclease